jgi:hypothetical protein
MRGGARGLLIGLAILTFSFGALAQSGANFKVEESQFNAGGNPANGAAPSSAGYDISLDAIAGQASATPSTSPNFSVTGGLVPAYPPPGEVQGFGYQGPVLGWDPDPSTGSYTLYRGSVGDLPGSFGAPIQAGITLVQVADPATPSAGQCFFYLVTAVNRIGEEGTKGTMSDGTPRP